MTELNIADRHVISILVDNEFGVLARVVSLFSARGYNIDSLSVAVVNKDKNLSRITITTHGSQEVIDLIIKLLNRLVAVYEAVDLTSSGAYAERECALIKIKFKQEEQDEILRIAQSQNANLIHHTKEYILLELTEEFSRIRAFLLLLEPYNIIEISRTGYAALSLGDKNILTINDTKN